MQSTPFYVKFWIIEKLFLTCGSKVKIYRCRYNAQSLRGGAVKLMRGGGGGWVTKNKSLKRYLTVKKALHNMRNLRFYIPEILKFWMGYHVCGPS